MPNGVDTAMQPMQPTLRLTPADRVVSQAAEPQVIDVDDAELPGGHASHTCICGFTVDLFALSADKSTVIGWRVAGHAGSVPAAVLRLNASVLQGGYASQSRRRS